MRPSNITIAATLCFMLLASAAVDAQTSTDQAKKLAGTIIKGCKDVKSKTCESYLKLAGAFCKTPKNVPFCTDILKETCKVSTKDCARLQAPFCAQTGTQEKACLVQAKAFLAKAG